MKVRIKVEPKRWYCYHCDQWFKKPIKVNAHKVCRLTNIGKADK